MSGGSPSFAVSVKNNPENKSCRRLQMSATSSGTEPDLLLARLHQERHEEDIGPAGRRATGGFQGQQTEGREFTVQSTTPYVSWEAKKGWKICGVQAGVVLENPAVSSCCSLKRLHLRNKERFDGGDGVRNHPGQDPRERHPGQGLRTVRGQDFSIKSVQHVTVFVKKK